MKNIISLLFTLFFISLTGISQENTVRWETEVEQNNDSIYTIHLKAIIEEGWHLYSQHLPEGGPLATGFTFENEKNEFEIVGKTLESLPHKQYEEIFKMETAYFEKEAIFTQKIKKNTNNLLKIKITATYQTCDDQACTFEPGEVILIDLTKGTRVKEQLTVDTTSKQLSNKLDLNIKNKEEFIASENSKKQQKGLTTIFLLGFFGGLIALLTPCVFPMIPLTVSFFTKQANKQSGITNAFLYGAFIIFIYLLLSAPFHFLDSLDPEILNSISTNVWLNISFFVIFIFFAISFFGYFEISLPHSWSNKMDSASDIGGIIGTFFMALTLAIVSFSCTGPILGSLLVGALSSDGGATQLTFGMVGFGAALALPFTLFALFPNWLNNLPKSGSWLNTVKVTLGFLEIALALKFLSNADMVEHWGILKRETFIILWILIFGALTLYLLGKIKFPHDSPVKKISLGRTISGTASGIFTLYLITGLFFNTSLNLLSGFAPPTFYSLQETETDCPLNLNCFKDFDEGVAHAKEFNKPILLDFTGWACVNCRKMEENVWSTPKVYTELEKYVIISLYIDDKKELPIEEQFYFQKPNGQTKHITTIGAKWATLQSLNFQTSSQPFYVLLSPDMELLNHPEEYEYEATYLQWLQDGLKRFSKAN